MTTRIAAALFILFALCCPALQAQSMKSILEHAPKMEKPCFKGVELYSWKLDGKQVWTILVGTNRNKTDAEIQNPKEAIHSLPELEKLLGKLCAKEYVAYIEVRRENPTNPPSPISKDVKRICEKLDLNFSQ